jgi:hypothetical protein
MTLVSTPLFLLAIAFVAVAAAVAFVSAGVIADFVVTNRKARLARQESLGTYYRELVSTH